MRSNHLSYHANYFKKDCKYKLFREDSLSNQNLLTIDLYSLTPLLPYSLAPVAYCRLPIGALCPMLNAYLPILDSPVLAC